MSTNPKRDAERRAKELGATITWDDSDRLRADLMLDAPPGYIWSGTDVHCRVIHGAPSSTGPGRKNTHDWIWIAALEDMAAGVERCTAKDCDVCTEE